MIYVVVGFRTGGLEISAANKVFSAFSGAARRTPECAVQWAQIHPGVAPEPGEVIVPKKRISAFTGSDLEVVSQAQNMRHLVLTSISASGGVLAALQEAAGKDYRLTVISDCCADRRKKCTGYCSNTFFRGRPVGSDWKHGCNTNGPLSVRAVCMYFALFVRYLFE